MVPRGACGPLQEGGTGRRAQGGMRTAQEGSPSGCAQGGTPVSALPAEQWAGRGPGEEDPPKARIRCRLWR